MPKIKLFEKVDIRPVTKLRLMKMAADMSTVNRNVKMVDLADKWLNAMMDKEEKRGK